MNGWPAYASMGAYTGGQVYYNQNKANKGNKGAVHANGVNFVKGK